MKAFTILAFTLLLIHGNLMAGFLDVPEKILKEMETKTATLKGSTELTYKIVYPKDYQASKSKEYKVAFALSGANGAERIVDYCYYVMFRSDLLKDHILIMPVASSNDGFRSLTAADSKNMIEAVTKQEKLNSENWLLIGSSNGGVGAFNMASATPKQFSGIIVIPGAISIKKIPSEWKKYNVLLAIGDKDKPWMGMTKQAEKKLKGKVNAAEKFTMKGQGHIVDKNYDINQVYKAYFEMK